jgi:hypothetical protein
MPTEKAVALAIGIAGIIILIGIVLWLIGSFPVEAAIL